jgi:predicted  nucleic acid-binding Zn-ribbon protein
VADKEAFGYFPKEINVVVTHKLDGGSLKILQDQIATGFSGLGFALSAIQQQVTKGEQTMSQISDKLATLGTTVDAAVTRVQTDIQALRDQIAALNTNAATPEDLAKIDELQAKLDALDPTVVAVLEGKKR